ncbi:MAG: putative DNA modification/repair radical SAM protein [Vallitaleaceae bacterium]|jgi:putative DNA modification/repair radical SAM protein|nr:putative DNA modification/repair radical SAM protein [Vallitaleaceae bacterium]
MDTQIITKLQTLAESAKYDVSCASSGVDKSNKGGLGNSAACGICHAWSSDGRCISLLKTLMTNDCVYDCAYCINRSSNDIRRESFTAEEVATLTIEFYRRNYIEGLFLSSAIEKNPNYTMEKILKVVQLLRHQHKFFGYIHVKGIPGADPALIRQVGLLVDRMSVNIELPTRESLRLLAPQKNPEKLFDPMRQIKDGILQLKDDRMHFKHAPAFVPAGQSTQMIVGATDDSDKTILETTEKLYKAFDLKRVYFSAYVPVNEGSLLPSIQLAPPKLREHRLYQADFLLRFYKFSASELLGEGEHNFDLAYDPKINWAFKHIEQFPMEINRVSVEELLRIPGIGTTSARRIMRQRKVVTIQYDDLSKMGVVMKRAKYFLTCNGKFYGDKAMSVCGIKTALNPPSPYNQMSLFA